MHELYAIKDMLMDELKQYSNKGELTSGTLEVVDKLTHSIKNICKIIEYMEDDEYSSYGGNAMYRGRGYRNDGMSYARGRGRNARRDSMGRYSRNSMYSMDSEDVVENLREIMQDIPNEHIKMEMQKLVQKMEQQM